MWVMHLESNIQEQTADVGIAATLAIEATVPVAVGAKLGTPTVHVGTRTSIK